MDTAEIVVTKKISTPDFVSVAAKIGYDGDSAWTSRIYSALADKIDPMEKYYCTFVDGQVGYASLVDVILHPGQENLYLFLAMIIQHPDLCTAANVEKVLIFKHNSEAAAKCYIDILKRLWATENTSDEDKSRIRQLIKDGAVDTHYYNEFLD
jgi:hypothetical protein